MSLFDDDDNMVIDLTFVKSVNEEPDKQTYLCRICTNEDSVLFQVTDPKELEFVGSETLWKCETCGWSWLSSDPMIRMQEKVHTIIPMESGRPAPPIFETVKPEAKDELRSTEHARLNKFDFNLDHGGLERLRHEGFQLRQEETHSSVSGRTHIAKPKPKSKQQTK